MCFAEDEGWLALAVAILTFRSVEEAFRFLNPLSEERKKTYHKWNPGEIADIGEMRKAGCSWEQIGQAYGVAAGAVHKMWNRSRA